MASGPVSMWLAIYNHLKAIRKHAATELALHDELICFRCCLFVTHMLVEADLLQLVPCSSRCPSLTSGLFANAQQAPFLCSRDYSEAIPSSMRALPWPSSCSIQRNIMSNTSQTQLWAVHCSSWALWILIYAILMQYLYAIIGAYSLCGNPSDPIIN